MPTVSVVMSVHDGQRYLNEAIESILNQTYRDFEFIIVDDGSRDATPDILRKHSCESAGIRVLKNNRNVGLTASLNRGIRASRGRFIARQDSDDISHPDRLGEQIKFLTDNPSVGMVGSRALEIDDTGQERGHIDFPIQPGEIRRRLFDQNVLVHGSILARKECLERVGHYREFFPTSQDRDLFLRFVEQFGIANHERYLYSYRVHSDAVTGTSYHRRQAYKRIIVSCARQRRDRGTDDFGLRYGDRWREGGSGVTRTKILSYHLYVESVARFFGGKHLQAIVVLALAMITYPRNALAQSFAREITHEVVMRLSMPRG